MPGPMRAAQPRPRYAASTDTASAPHTGDITHHILQAAITVTITGQEVRSAAPALGERVEPLIPGPPVEEEEAVDEAAAEEEGETIMGETEGKWFMHYMYTDVAR